MLVILCNLLHGVNAVSEQSFCVFFLGGVCEHISQAHASEKRDQLFLEVCQVHQNQPQLGCLLMSQAWIT